MNKNYIRRIQAYNLKNRPGMRPAAKSELQ